MSEQERDDLWKWLKTLVLLEKDTKSDWDKLYDVKKSKEWDE